MNRPLTDPPRENRSVLTALIAGLPKVKLHMHIEGSLEPELMFTIAERNGIALKYDSVDAVRAAYRFGSLHSFLDIYYEACSVLRHERHFYDVTMAYLQRAHAQHGLHTEVFFGPQSHTQRGVPFATVLSGLRQALTDGERMFGITSRLIMCFLRHLSAESALDTLEQALPYREHIVAVGPDSYEVAHPPAQFDHGVRYMHDEALVGELLKRQVSLTVCPLSNVKLRVFDRLEEHNPRQMLHRGLCVTVNCDDPAYFGGYIVENFVAAQQTLHLTAGEIYQLTVHAI